MAITKSTANEIQQFGGDHGVPVEKIIKRFESEAYDKYMHEYLGLAPAFAQSMNATVQSYADALQENGGGDVLLVSIGSGRDLPNLNLHRNRDLHVTGIDINPNMTKGARAKVKAGQLENRVEVIDDMQVSEVRDRLGGKKYDLVLWAYSGSCVPDRLDSWNAVTATIKTGGIFIYTDYIGAMGDTRFSEILRAQEENRDIIRSQGVKLYKPEDVPDYVNLTVSHPQIALLVNSQGQEVISVAGDIEGVEDPTIIFDTLNPALSLSGHFQNKSLNLIEQEIQIVDQVRSNCMLVYQKR